MSYQVKIETFEGPLDLLLYLIRKNDMDIRDIEIAKITAQYLDFLNAMRTLDVDLASEFIVMAATLIYIKSKMLLPSPEEENEEEVGDPRATLMQRLIEYQRYKIAAETLSKRPKLNEDLFKVHLVPPKIERDFDPREGLIEVGVYELALAFQEMVKRSKKIIHHIEADAITMEEKIIELANALKTNTEGAYDFKKLVRAASSKVEIVVAFMAMLELTRLRCIKLYQAGHGSEIHIKATDKLAAFDINDVRQLHIEGEA